MNMFIYEYVCICVLIIKEYLYKSNYRIKVVSVFVGNNLWNNEI